LWGQCKGTNLAHNVDEEVGEGHAPDEGVLQHVVDQRLPDAGLGLLLLLTLLLLARLLLGLHILPEPCAGTRQCCVCVYARAHTQSIGRA